MSQEHDYSTQADPTNMDNFLQRAHTELLLIRLRNQMPHVCSDAVCHLVTEILVNAPLRDMDDVCQALRGMPEGIDMITATNPSKLSIINHPVRGNVPSIYTLVEHITSSEDDLMDLVRQIKKGLGYYKGRVVPGSAIIVPGAVISPSPDYNIYVSMIVTE